MSFKWEIHTAKLFVMRMAQSSDDMMLKSKFLLCLSLHVDRLHMAKKVQEHATYIAFEDGVYTYGVSK